MGWEEVLEYVEKPLLLFQKLYSLLKENETCYIKTAVNEPTVDHIYLFRNKEEVFDMARESGFEVMDYICAPTNEMDIQRAERKKAAISMTFLKKGGGGIQLSCMHLYCKPHSIPIPSIFIL